MRVDFIHQPQPGRVVFRVGALSSLAEEAGRLGARALVLSTPEQREAAALIVAQLGGLAVGLFDGAVMHVPVETARAAREMALRVGADLCVAVGGGSTIGLGKAIALEYGLPILAVPTTYAGSEMTPIWGLTEGGEKRTGRDPKVLPRTVIYDPELTVTLPVALSVTSGINAIAHCVEALYADDGNPILDLMAEEGIRALAAGLARIVETPSAIEARAETLYGAWLAGTCLGGAGVALHHKLCHVLGGSFGLPHSETHTIVLPHAAAFNRSAAPDAMARVARALGAEDGPRGLYDLAGRLGAPRALSQLGLKESDLDRAAELATRQPYPNPRPLTTEGVRALLQDAYEGNPPAKK